MKPDGFSKFSACNLPYNIFNPAHNRRDLNLIRKIGRGNKNILLNIHLYYVFSSQSSNNNIDLRAQLIKRSFLLHRFLAHQIYSSVLFCFVLFYFSFYEKLRY
jgi:hypothetical protein